MSGFGSMRLKFPGIHPFFLESWAPAGDRAVLWGKGFREERWGETLPLQGFNWEPAFLASGLGINTGLSYAFPEAFSAPELCVCTHLHCARHSEIYVWITYISQIHKYIAFINLYEYIYYVVKVYKYIIFMYLETKSYKSLCLPMCVLKRK
jgi:hypothetical protein